jgi:O-antigen/teichoic acid export membrane protein
MSKRLSRSVLAPGLVTEVSDPQRDTLRLRSPIRAADPEQGDLRSRVTTAVGWKGASGVVGQLTKLMQVVVLTRLLSPHDFGVAGMGLMLVPFVVNFSDFGLGIALVQRRTITDRDASSVFWASVGIGAIVSALGAATAPFVAHFYHQSEVTPLFATASLGFVITSLGSTHRSLLVRSMNFRALELRSIASALAGAVVGITMAVFGAGPWAFIGMFLTGAVTSTALLCSMAGWHPSRTVSMRSIRELASFGGRYLGGTTFLTLNQNADNILVGRFLGAASLGFYSLAYSVILSPLSRLASPVMQILTPAFSRLQDDKKALATGWLRATPLLAVVVLPLTLTVAVTAHDLVLVVFGRQWTAAVPVMQILACVSAMQCLQLHDVVLQAMGRMRVYLWVSAASFALNLSAFIVGLRWGIVGVSAAFAVSSSIYFVAYTVVVSRALGIRPIRFLQALAGVLQGAVALVLAEFTAKLLVDHSGLAALPRIAVVTAAGLGAFFAVCAWRAPDVFGELRRLWAHRFARHKVVPAQAVQASS